MPPLKQRDTRSIKEEGFYISRLINLRRIIENHADKGRLRGRGDVYTAGKEPSLVIVNERIEKATRQFCLVINRIGALI